jgi:hypothetical protein
MGERDPEELQLLYQRLEAAKQDLPLAFGWLQKLVDDLAEASWGDVTSASSQWIRDARKLGLTNDMALYVHYSWLQTGHVLDEAAVKHILSQLHVFRTLHYTKNYGSSFNGAAGPFMTEELCLQFKRSMKLTGQAVRRSPAQSPSKARSK